MLAALLDDSMDGNRRWRALGRQLLESNPAGSDVYELFQAIVRYDQTLAAALARPLPVPLDPVVVSGSGKELFKTFKGCVELRIGDHGALDVLRYLGIKVADRPGDIGEYLQRHGIAFVHYRTFCPRFFDRYDGLFAELQPTSLLMPVAALCIRATAFVHGLAAPLSQAAAEAIALACPHLQRGVVVGAEPAPGRTIDEFSRHGRSWRSTLLEGRIDTHQHQAAEASARWFRRVAQRASNQDNAALLWKVLTGVEQQEALDLVYDNAALVIEMAHMVPYDEARRRAQVAHTSGRAGQLLQQLGTWRPIRGEDAAW